MKEVKKEDRYKIADFFKDWEDTLIKSCLQGYMGEAYADDLEQPKSASIIVGDFCFLAGEPNKEVVKSLFMQCELEALLVVSKDALWEQFIESEYDGRYKKMIRYAIKKEEGVFDKEILQAYVKGIPSHFVIKKIDEVLYKKTQKENWSSDLCSQFKTYEDYEEKGLGYVVLDGDLVVSGASSYTVYDKGIEIQIDTHKDYRRQGLALACAASLILACLDRRLYPSWDAATKASVALAEKLGYHFDEEYITYGVRK